MDIFEEEQNICDNAEEYIKAVEGGAAYHIDEFKTLAYEYRMILKQLRRMTKLSDKTTVDLNEINMDLIDKVHYDALTGIYNRRFMQETLQHKIDLLAESNSMLSIMMIDIDLFKKYNDTYGHSVGDDCLQAVATVIANMISTEEDFVARYGGEEFFVALSHVGKDKAIVYADNILKAVRDLVIPHVNSDVAKYVTVSIGVTTISPAMECNYIDCITYADAALYESKRNGRNCYTYTTYDDNIIYK